MPPAVIGRWGESLAVRVPGDVAEAVGFGDRQKVEIRAESNAVVIRKLPTEETVEAMFDGRSPEGWRGLYADAYDWGPIRGASAPRNDD